MNQSLQQALSSQAPSPEPAISASEALSGALLSGTAIKGVMPFLAGSEQAVQMGRAASKDAVIVDLARTQLGGLLDRLSRRSFGTGPQEAEAQLLDQARRAIATIEQYGQPVATHIKRFVEAAAGKSSMGISRIKASQSPADKVLSGLLNEEQVLKYGMNP